MDIFGSFALLLALLCAVYAFVAGIFAIRTRNPLFIKSARNAGMAVCVLIFIATASLIYLFFRIILRRVRGGAQQQHAADFLKISALWAGRKARCCSGAFCFRFMFSPRCLRIAISTAELMPYVGVVLAGVQIFF